MFEGEQPGNSGGGITGSAKRLLEAGTAFLSTKLELIGVELHEEKRRILELLILASAALLFAVLALIMFTFAILALFWENETHRWIAVGALFVFYVLTSVWLFIRLQRKANMAAKIFETTVDELKKDTEWVKRHL